MGGNRGIVPHGHAMNAASAGDAGQGALTVMVFPMTRTSMPVFMKQL